MNKSDSYNGFSKAQNITTKAVVRVLFIHLFLSSWQIYQNLIFFHIYPLYIYIYIYIYMCVCVCVFKLWLCQYLSMDAPYGRWRNA